MKKIGFIDYYLDEWHANQYPEWLRRASGGSMQVTCAYALQDAPEGLSNSEWCERRGIALLPSLHSVVEESDYLIVLSPDHPEYHEQLSELPLKSGKPTYIDKTFAPDRNTAIRLFQLARSHGTPMYSTSALRYAEEWKSLDIGQKIEAICTIGPGRFENYAIHQLEPAVALIRSKPRRVMDVSTATSSALIVLFENGTQVTLRHFDKACPFGMAVHYASGQSTLAKVESDFFAPFIENLVAFFDSRQPAVSVQETVAIVTILEYGRIASAAPYQWLDLPTDGDEEL